METFIFNNKNAWEDLGIFITKQVEFPLPQETIDFIEVEGRSGALTIKRGTYSDLEISMELGFLYKGFRKKIINIQKWLFNIEDNTLKFTDYMEKCYKVKKVEVSDINREIKIKGSFTAKFICEPFLYDSIPQKNIFKTEEILNNDSSIESYPVIKINSGEEIRDIIIKINSKEFKLKQVSGDIIINSELLTVTSFGENILSKTLGNFPIISPGRNKIILSGIENIQITPNFRYLY